jgi:hypothetical protein
MVVYVRRVCAGIGEGPGVGYASVSFDLSFDGDEGVDLDPPDIGFNDEDNELGLFGPVDGRAEREWFKTIRYRETGFFGE